MWLRGGGTKLWTFFREPDTSVKLRGKGLAMMTSPTHSRRPTVSVITLDQRNGVHPFWKREELRKHNMLLQTAKV